MRFSWLSSHRQSGYARPVDFDSAGEWITDVSRTRWLRGGLAPHDLRRTCARLFHASEGELEQIQFLLGHVSVQMTERYLGCKKRIRSAVNDRIESNQTLESPGF